MKVKREKEKTRRKKNDDRFIKDINEDADAEFRGDDDDDGERRRGG